MARGQWKKIEKWMKLVETKKEKRNRVLYALRLGGG
jgi:hypothetical protein